MSLFAILGILGAMLFVYLIYNLAVSEKNDQLASDRHHAEDFLRQTRSLAIHKVKTLLEDIDDGSSEQMNIVNKLDEMSMTYDEWDGLLLVYRKPILRKLILARLADKVVVDGIPDAPNK